MNYQQAIKEAFKAELKKHCTDGADRMTDQRSKLCEKLDRYRMMANY